MGKKTGSLWACVSRTTTEEAEKSLHFISALELLPSKCKLTQEFVLLPKLEFSAKPLESVWEGSELGSNVKS